MKKTVLPLLVILLAGCLQTQPQIATETAEKDISLRDVAIREYLLSQNEFSWTTEAGSARECVFADLNPGNKLFPRELWVYCSEFQNGKELSGSSGPVLLDYPNEFSFFDLEKFTHKIPRDGSFFGDDVRSIFSATAQKKIFDRAVVDELRAEMDVKISAEN